MKTSRARYACYGVLFGGCFPLVATLCDLIVQGLTFSPAQIWSVPAAQPLHWISDTAPLFGGWFASLAGKQQDISHQLNKQLEQRNVLEVVRSTALAQANAHAAELMVELEDARQLLEEQNKQLDLHNRFIRQILGRYLTNEVVASLLDDPAGLKLGGEKREVSLLMADLRGFTSLSRSGRVEATAVKIGEWRKIVI